MAFLQQSLGIEFLPTEEMVKGQKTNKNFAPTKGERSSYLKRLAILRAILGKTREESNINRERVARKGEQLAELKKKLEKILDRAEKAEQEVYEMSMELNKVRQGAGVVNKRFNKANGAQELAQSSTPQTTREKLRSIGSDLIKAVRALIILETLSICFSIPIMMTTPEKAQICKDPYFFQWLLCDGDAYEGDKKTSVPEGHFKYVREHGFRLPWKEWITLLY